MDYYMGLDRINGTLMVVNNVKGAAYDEIVEIETGGRRLTGNVVGITGDTALVRVFEGTKNLSLTNTRTHFTGKPMQLGLSREILGRIFNGSGKPADGLGEICKEKYMDVNGMPINPVSREYPRNYIQTGFSAIDGLSTLIRGQKLPIFSGSGMKHNQLAAMIAAQAKVTDNSEFAIVFAALGVKSDVAEFFKNSFKETGALSRVTMFVNLANDPIIERITTPRLALTAAEYLAFECEMNVLVIMTDITSYAEALRETSSSMGEIPGRKGYPGYLYSDLSSIYERAGMIKGRKGSVTQMPILTMPNDDISHPIPDLTGYITEGQIVLDRYLENTGVFPPVSVLPSLSRLMKDGIGEGFTRADHPALSNQLFSSYSKVQDVRALAQVIGEEELSATDKIYLKFGEAFEKQFINQKKDENRTMEETLNLGWKIISILPKSELDRLDNETIEKYYVPGE